MTDNPTGPDLFEMALAHVRDAREKTRPGSTNEVSLLRFAGIYADLARTAAIVTQTELIAAPGIGDDELDAWRRVIPMPPLAECKSKARRRPECEDRHTEDCTYAEPGPEPKHVLLPVGTRVLVSDLMGDDETQKPERKNPVPGRISGYTAANTKYRWQYETSPGHYLSCESYAFADNRVEVHPDGPECPPAPEPVKREPTGPRVYVQRKDGLQGHIVDTFASEHGYTWATIHWYRPGREDSNIPLDTVTVIHPGKVERCPNGQTGDECDSGENQCELCLQAEDAEADMIEESMGLR